MTEAYIAVGDIHGCLEQLLEVMEKCSRYSAHRYIFLGDYIDRGPSSNEVIDTVRSVDGIYLMGNHEQSLFWYLKRDHKDAKGDGGADVPVFSERNLLWIQNELKLYFETGNAVFVHAGFDPRRPLSDQDSSDMLWSRYRGDYSALTDKTVMHGHVKVPRIDQCGNRVNINTGCGFGGPLSACVMPEKQVIQSHPSPQYSQGRLEKVKEELMQICGVEAELEDA